MVTLAVHDLVELSDETVDELSQRAMGEGQPWVCEALARSPWVVARRANPTDTDHTAVGVRGTYRHQRWGTEIRTAGCLQVLAPSDLLAVSAVRDLPAFRALDSLKLMKLPGVWGPGGSVGAELASGHPTVTENSDLDVVVRLDSLPDRISSTELLESLCTVTEQTGVRIDALVETPVGGVNLQELAEDGGSIVTRTPDGPVLLVDARSDR
jgi:phosphoribosyl-dephospho-CoA transferase